MTTEGTGGAGGTGGRAWLAPALALPPMLLGWLGVLALTLRLAGGAEALVVAPPAGFLLRLPPGLAVVDRNALGLVLRGEGDVAAAAYAAGARVVLPAGLAGCLALEG